MKDTWSLDALYKGYDDHHFLEDKEELHRFVKELKLLPEVITKDKEKESLHLIIRQKEKFQTLIAKLASYVSLRQSVDTTDVQTISLLSELEACSSECTNVFAQLDRFIQQIENIDQYCEEDAFLKDYHYYLKKIQEDADYQLHDDVEEVIAKLNLSAGNAWEKMQEYLTSTLVIQKDNQTYTLSEIRNLAYHEDKVVRKTAYEAELKAYQNIQEPIAFALNNIKSQVNTICDLRGFASPLAMTLHQSCMKQETLNTMLSCIKEYLPHFQRYLKHKAKQLGYQNGLPWYELFASHQTNQRKFALEDAKQYLLKHFTHFSQDMANMIERAFDEQWIDFYPRKGKIGGAFCANLPMIKQSRILTNFDGSLSDVITLAHELGHAYHGMMIENHAPLNTDYSMPVAETASTFNENIIMDALLEEEKDSTRKLALLESQLQDTTQIICDIYSRFLFESWVFEQRKNTFLFADDLCKLMIQAQKEAYGNALDEKYMHPYMWINKSHYYSPSLSFYNFPYAFGGLFARGLFMQYKKEKSDFVKTYQDMLKATTISDVEDVAKIAGIDLTQKTFWNMSLESYRKQIDDYISF